MTLLLVVTALSFTCLGAGIGLIAGHHLAHRDARGDYEQQLEQIAALNYQLYEQPAYGDD